VDDAEFDVDGSRSVGTSCAADHAASTPARLPCSWPPRAAPELAARAEHDSVRTDSRQDKRPQSIFAGPMPCMPDPDIEDIAGAIGISGEDVRLIEG
jgi:hypothetical protein